MINTKWIKIYNCPLCSHKHESIPIGYLPIERYHFGSEIIGIENGPITLFKCTQCGLFYKDVLPSKAFLKNIFTTLSDTIWGQRCNLKKQINLINNYISIKELNILDIGPSNGSFLKQVPCSGRKSGLDIVVYPELIDSLTGEFIEGFIDQDTLQWSGDKYDLITAFDIFEHLYNPRQAFKNIKNFLNDNGYLAIETGNINSKWPKKYGPHNWWYVALFEHHIFWSLESIKKIAADEGFEFVFQIEKRHKFRSGANWWTLVNDLLLTFLYYTSPFLFFHLKNLTKPSILQPWSPIVKDHIFVILKYLK